MKRISNKKIKLFIERKNENSNYIATIYDSDKRFLDNICNEKTIMLLEKTKNPELIVDILAMDLDVGFHSAIALYEDIFEKTAKSIKEKEALDILKGNFMFNRVGTFHFLTL